VKRNPYQIGKHIITVETRAMVKSKLLKLVLDGHGSYFGMEKGCFILRDREGNTEKYPLFESEIGEIQFKSGNMVSTGALASCGFWGIDCLFLTQKGKPVAMLKSLDDDSHVNTRVCQYEALSNGKGVHIAKQLVLGKIEGQNQVLNKYGLKLHDFSHMQSVKDLEADDMLTFRRKLMAIEGHCSDRYFSQIFTLLPQELRPNRRKTFKAYDGVNNIFNLAYEILSWKIQHALIKAKLEPYLGFLHSIAKGKPSLICDFMELYRYLVDDFVIQYCCDLQKKDFMTKSESFYKDKKGKREYLCDSLTSDLVRRLNQYFQKTVNVSRIRMGESQEIETLINEEALLLAEYLRSETKTWKPRIVG
jgi:CRISPR-associated protein Cas1